MITSIKNHYSFSDISGAIKFLFNNDTWLDLTKQDDKSGGQVPTPLSSWKNHYRSWINSKEFPIKLIKYEELEKNTEETFKKVIHFINENAGLKNDYNSEKAKKCVESCDFNILKKNEEKFGFKESPIGQKTKKKLSFFNLGSKNKWVNILPKKILEELNILFKEDLKKLNYE